jgi:hypothetical protein
VEESILSREEIIKGLKDKRLYVISKKIDLSYPTLKKLARGEEENYTIDTLKKVSKYIKDSSN